MHDENAETIERITVSTLFDQRHPLLEKPTYIKNPLKF